MDVLNKKISKILNDNNNKSGKYLTNKSCRIIKKIFNQELNLIDHLFQGYHNDNTLIGSHYNDEKEIKMISDIFTKASFTSIKKSEKIINKWNTTDINLLPVYKRLIIYGLQKYRIELFSSKIKVNELYIYKECFKYYKGLPLDPSTNITHELDIIEKEFKKGFSDNLQLNSFNDSFIFIIDNTNSMNGYPNEIALMYSLFMIKVLKIKKIYFLDVINFSILQLSDLDYKSLYLYLIKKIYRKCFGYISFQDKLNIINKNNFTNKKILFLTSSNDLDVLKKYNNIGNNNLIIMNLRENKINIPYIDINKKIYCIDGNNLKIFLKIINSLYSKSYASILTNNSININSIILSPLEQIDVSSFGKIQQYNKSLSNERISELFIAYSKNIPPKITNLTLS
jgi:hypothetical protein